jgi:chromosome segregation ATPase
MSDIVDRKISLPMIKRVALANFDLYSNEPNASTVIERPVFCLIGANGLGKSTFLNTINFAITGAIPDPSRKFQSAQDYLRNAGRTDRSDDYFSGRISEHARSIASATVELAWPSAALSVTRDLFGGAGVTRLAIEDVTSGAIDVWQSSDDDGNGLTGRYQAKVLELTGLEDFAQFVFLMHFVATFDEGRHLLMWDDAALTNALYLAFGADPIAAKAADKLQRDMERESSRGRNVRFSARHVAERIKQLADLLKGTENDDHTTGAELQAQHDALVARQSEAEQRMRRKQAELRDADLKWTDLSASLTETQLEYRRLFSSRLQQSSSVDHHPIIRATLSEDRCALCGTVHVAAKIQAALDKGDCPLCDSVLDRSGGDATAISELQRVDREIARIRDDLATILSSRARISDEFTAAQASEEAVAEELRQFEEKEAAGLAKVQSGSSFSAIQQEIDKLEKERQEFLAQSEAHYRKRDELRDQLRSYEKEARSSPRHHHARQPPRRIRPMLSDRVATTLRTAHADGLR